jgi:sodium-dependent phosphate transporter
MELGNIITVVIAARFSIPISTTQGIVGSTAGVALCDGGVKSVNWRLALWMYFGWFVVLPVTTLVSYCLTARVLSAPNWMR